MTLAQELEELLDELVVGATRQTIGCVFALSLALCDTFPELNAVTDRAAAKMSA